MIKWYLIIQVLTSVLAAILARHICSLTLSMFILFIEVNTGNNIGLNTLLYGKIV